VVVLADAILASAEGGEANNDNDDNDALGGKRGERRGSDDHDDDDDDGDDGTDGPCRCCHGGGRPFPVASEDQRLACWTLSNLVTPQGTRAR
jgi:hypothetical protein